MNPYYESLLNPMTVMGVRIPDDSTTNTVTFSIIKRFPLTVNANGVAACIIGEAFNTGTPAGFMIPNPSSNSIGGTVGQYVVGFQNHTGATAGSLFSNATTTSGSPPITLEQWNSTSDSVPNLVATARLVSAGFSARSTVSDMNNSGLYAAAFLPKGYVRALGTVGGLDLSACSIDAILAAPGSITEPVNSGKGVSLTYQPLDETCRMYVDLDVAADTLSDAVSEELYMPGGFVCAVTGAYATSTIQCVLVLNYEGTPLHNTLIFQNSVDTAVDDPIAIAETMNRISSDDTARAGTHGFEGLHSTGYTVREMYHPIALRSGLHNGLAESSGMVIHSSPVRCHSSSKREKASTKVIKQDESMFSKLLKTVGNIAIDVAPKLLAAI